MKKTFTMLGKNYNDERVFGWYASEKLDGVRALWYPDLIEAPWNDELGTGLWSRDGKVYHAPDWWLRKLPNVPLDGELWVDRKAFQTTTSIVRRHEATMDWNKVKFMAFDMPVKIDPGIISFRNKDIRIKELIQLNKKISKPMIFRTMLKVLSRYPENEVFQIVKQERISSIEEAYEMLNKVVSKGGEGVMLRNPDSTWEQCRSGNLLKLKPVLEMEVEVTGYYYGDGKYDGMMGALEVALPNGRLFKVSGFTDEERQVESNGYPFSRSVYDDCKFKVGSKINISYRELTNDGIPKEARYNRRT